MSCGPFKTAEARTKHWLRQQGAIDQYLNILDINKFRRLHRQLRELMVSKHGLEEQSLFWEEQSPYDKKYTRAIPNSELFRHIDSLNNINYEPEINYTLKAVNILQSDKAKQIFEKGKKNNWDLNKILTELQVPKEQKQIILDKYKGKVSEQEFIKSIFPDTKVKKIVYHGTRFDFNKFDKSFIGKQTQSFAENLFYFIGDIQSAEDYSKYYGLEDGEYEAYEYVIENNVDVYNPSEKTVKYFQDKYGLYDKEEVSEFLVQNKKDIGTPRIIQAVLNIKNPNTTSYGIKDNQDGVIRLNDIDNATASLKESDIYGVKEPEQIHILTEEEQAKIYNEDNLREEIITSLLADNSFVVEINTAKDIRKQVAGSESFYYENSQYIAANPYVSTSKPTKDGFPISQEEFDRVASKVTSNNTQYYSNLTVPEIKKIILGRKETTIDYKKYLLGNLNNRIKRLKSAIKKSKKDKVKYSSLIKKQQELETIANGNKELGILGLADEIAQLESTSNTDQFINLINQFAEKDFERIKKLIEGDKHDIAEAKDLIEYYKKLGNFEGDTHPLFMNEEVKDLSDEILSHFKSYQTLAETYNNSILEKEKDLLMEDVNSSSNVKKLNENLTYEDLVHKEKGLKDASWIDMMVMDINYGIFSENGILPQVMWTYISEKFEKYNTDYVDISERINKLQPVVSKKLKQKGYGLANVGIGGIKLFDAVRYDLFYRKDEFGNSPSELVQIYTKEYEEKIKRINFIYNDTLRKSRSQEGSDRATIYNVAHNKKMADLHEVSEIINFTSLPEIQAEFGNDFEFNINPEYVNRLKKQLTEKGYNEIIKKQLELLRQWKSQTEVHEESFLLAHNADSVEQLDGNLQFKLAMHQANYNPLNGVERFNYGTVEVSGVTVNPYYATNIFIPKNDKYYDNQYKEIAQDEDLYAFYEVANDVITFMNDVLPEDIKSKVSSSNTIYSVRQTVIESIANNKNIGLFKALSKAASLFYDKLKGKFGINVDDNFSYAKENPLTGEKNYKVNSNFVSNNAKQIDLLFQVKAASFNQLLNLDNLDIKKYTEINIQAINGNALQYLLNQTNLTREQLISKYGNMIPVGRIFTSSATHEVVQNQSMDLPKVLKYFTYMTAEYAARSEALPSLELMKRHYEEIKNPQTSNIGKTLTNVRTADTEFIGPRTRANKQMQDWFDRVVLGNYDMKHFGTASLKIPDKLVPDFLAKKLDNTGNGKILTSEEKRIRKELDNLISKMSDKDPNKAKLIKRREDLGKTFAASAGINAILDYIRFLGLGYNLPASITNLMAGTISNLTVASTGDFFTPGNIYYGYKVAQQSFVKNISFGKIKLGESEKARILMDRYNVLQDASNELQKASVQSAISGLRRFEPYELTRKTEYLNQTPLMIAILMDTKIKGKDGSESSVWEAMDNQGKLKGNFSTKKNIEAWEQTKGKDYATTKTHIVNTIKTAHGNYDDKSGMMAKSSVAGRAILMFKSWMPMMFFTRFAKEQDIVFSNIKGYKGRYRSLTPTTGATLAGLFGFATAGPIGALLFGVGGGLAASKYGADASVPLLKEMGVTAKLFGRKLVGLPVNMITGKETIKDTEDLSDFLGEGFTERDMKNYQANMVDISILTVWIALTLLTKLIFWDDEDEATDPKRKTHNLLVNELTKLSSESITYINPVQIHKNVTELPVIRFSDNVIKTGIRINKAVEGHDTIIGGYDSGKSGLYNQAERTFLPSIARGGVGFETRMKRQFQPTPYDKWFHSKEEIAKLNTREMRAKYKNKLTKKYKKKSTAEINNMVNEKYPKKQRDQSYQDLLRQYKGK